MVRIAIPLALLILIAAAGLSGCQPGSDSLEADHSQTRQQGAQAFAVFRQNYLLDYWANHPIEATQAGQTQYANRLPALSPGDIQRQIDQLENHLNWLKETPASVMSNARLQAARNQIQAHAREQLLLLEAAQIWRRDPRLYLAESAFLQLADAELGSTIERAQWLKARLDQLPVLLETGLSNLSAPPQRFTIDAIRSAQRLSETLDRLVQDLADASPELEEGLLSALRTSQFQLDVYRTELKAHVLPTSAESAGVGPEVYRRFLEEVHGIRVPVDEWLERSEHEWNLVNLADEPSQAERKHRALIWLDARVHSGELSADGARHFLIDELGISHSETAQEIDNLLQYPSRILNRWSESD